MQKVDFHIHTNISDGLLTPEEVIKLSIKNNCTDISITDHEITADYTNLEKQYGITIISGIEFNTSISNLHVLGYGIKNIFLVNNEMINLRKKNEEICYQVIDLMKNNGYDISIEKIIEYLKKINLNYDIIDKRKIVKYLIYKGYASNTLDAYQELIGKNQEFYVPNHKISPEKIINLINDSGGISVIAHPNTINMQTNKKYELIKELTLIGLSGIEIINSKMKLNQSNIYERIADELKLIKTVGSDFHDYKTDEIGIYIDDLIYEQFKERLLSPKIRKKMI